jgi:hypothetical protein
MKQTPMQEAIQKVNQLAMDNKTIVQVNLILENLLEKEKQVIINSAKYYMNTDGIINEDELAEYYYTETFKQK